MNLDTSTISGNTSGSGAGIYNGGFSFNISNTIVAQNSGANLIGSVSDFGYNLVGSNGPGSGFGSTSIIINDANVGLAPLGYYGGNTPTFALLPGSPALNAGNPALTGTFDQRGKAQYGIRDIGAYESQGFTTTITGGNQSATLGTTFAPVTITVTANDVLLTNLTGGKITLAPPGSGATATGTLTKSLAFDNGSGTYRATFSDLTAATATGTYSISVNGVPPATSFQLTNLGVSVIVTSDILSKIYGALDPAFSYSSASTLLGGDTLASILMGALTRTGGENVGLYDIQQGSLALNAYGMTRYTLTFDNSNITDFSITPRAITVQANAQTKIYGDGDPTLTFTTGPLYNGDSQATAFSGGLTRTGTQDVGSYVIGQGSLASSNYSISFMGNTFSITPRALAVQANQATKIYGNADPALTYSTGALFYSDTLATVLSGALSRTGMENVGNYTITPGNLAASSNYSISFTGAGFTITPRSISVIPTAKPD